MLARSETTATSKFSFCRPVAAKPRPVVASRSTGGQHHTSPGPEAIRDVKLHIRTLTAAGRFPFGPIDTPSICGLLAPDADSCDVAFTVTKPRVAAKGTCEACAEAYAKIVNPAAASEPEDDGIAPFDFVPSRMHELDAIYDQLPRHWGRRIAGGSPTKYFEGPWQGFRGAVYAGPLTEENEIVVCGEDPKHEVLADWIAKMHTHWPAVRLTLAVAEMLFDPNTKPRDLPKLLAALKQSIVELEEVPT